MLTPDELEDRLRRWSDLERAAIDAEEKLWAAGAADDIAALAQEAAGKRKVADAALSELLGEVKHQHAPAANDARGGDARANRH